MKKFTRKIAGPVAFYTMVAGIGFAVGGPACAMIAVAVVTVVFFAL